MGSTRSENTMGGGEGRRSGLVFGSSNGFYGAKFLLAAPSTILCSQQDTTVLLSSATPGTHLHFGPTWSNTKQWCRGVKRQGSGPSGGDYGWPRASIFYTHSLTSWDGPKELVQVRGHLKCHENLAQRRPPACPAFPATGHSASSDVAADESIGLSDQLRSFRYKDSLVTMMSVSTASRLYYCNAFEGCLRT